MLGTNRKGCDRYVHFDFWPAQQEWLRRYFVFEPATYGLEGLVNLLKTIVDNGLSSPDLGVRQNTRCHGIRWGQILSTRCLQEVIEKTDLKYLLTKLFTRHFMDISFYCFLVSLIFISLTNRNHNHCYSLIYYFIDKTIATRS